MTKQSGSRQSRRVVLYHEERCLNCGSCELACSISHTVSQNLVQAVLAGETAVRRRWLRLADQSKVAINCQHCEPAACVDACIAGAMHKGSGAETIHDPDKCVGCWMCIMVCPFGALKRISDQKIVVKCDYCAGQEQLACFQNCPTKAIEIMIIEE
ncbi:4Fe-4S dicluster domain-containing protein [candidate division CSSED10-310 bacterium]|uniref:4Fe-4S dicluster domain-containing protein n=1 Tax=candidate division CSSED10-310 bacterium TaxID=2855610 RepID=A0ABV6Z3V5_UNCC1